MVFFDRRREYRSNADLDVRIERAIERDPERFSSYSHFVRVGVLRLLKEVEVDEK